MNVGSVQFFPVKPSENIKLSCENLILEMRTVVSETK